MKRKLELALLTILSLFFLPNVYAANLLTGEVTYNNDTKLYTYTYTLDTTTLLDHIVNISILQNLGFDWSHPLPVVHTEPAVGDWMFKMSAGGLSNSGALNIYGTFWTWEHNYFSESVSNVGNLVFSITTPRGVNTSTANNYFIYNGGATTGPSENAGFIEIGHIVGPEFINFTPPVAVPEQQVYVMMIVGLGLISLVRFKSIAIIKRRAC
ncbi:hypothetical protein [Methylophilus sp. Leaf414]|uniref:hypothetical protein n=1 Tax=Methylophilus sp. Leaf414 TaxID=1736371 RepID=UPI0006F70102|nr:hypothetical protein [Methylophilus sp. Leaf414]KQT33211.1 hypothetical protein ASG24_12980 [Methylophilus sp. Leaf414]